MAQKKLRVRLVHSTIGRDGRQEKIVKGLGLRKTGTERELIDTPEVRGMVKKVPHLVQIVEENIAVKKKAAPKQTKEEVKNEA